MIRKTRGIVLHTTRYGESSLVVHCYTEQFGRQTYMVKGVRKSRRNNRANLFQPLFILNFEVYHKDKSEMHLVKEVSRDFPLTSLPYDITKSTQALFMAEVLYRTIREEEANPMMGRFLIHSIQYLDTLEDAQPDFHIVFLFQLSRHLGFFPQNNFSKSAPYFDLASGQFRSWMADPELQLDKESSALWSKYIESDFQGNVPAGVSGSERKFILDSMVHYFKNHVEGMGEIRSLEVLHSFFHP